MIKIVPGGIYKDCTPQDFNHYFNETFMVFHLTDIKRRIFIPEQLDGDIMGRYLTRKKEWKTLMIKWSNWTERLSLIMPFPISFNLPSGAGFWSPNIAKQGQNSSGYRKSFPNIQTKGVLRLYGNITPTDKSLQNLVFSVFGDIYKDREYGFPYLKDEPRLNKLATACAGDFIVDRNNGTLLFKGTQVAGYKDGEITLLKDFDYLRDVMIDRGASPSQIKIAA